MTCKGETTITRNRRRAKEEDIRIGQRRSSDSGALLSEVSRLRHGKRDSERDAIHNVPSSRRTSYPCLVLSKIYPLFSLVFFFNTHNLQLRRLVSTQVGSHFYTCKVKAKINVILLAQL